MRELAKTGRAGITAVIVVAIVLLLSVGAARAQSSSALTRSAEKQSGLEAFRQIAAVLRSPRCLNCHPRNNSPRQGDDRHIHANLVRRGPDDKGVPGQLCSTCHQTENNESSGVPGRPNWHLAPLSMGWDGLSDGELCRTLKDPKRNGGRDLKALTEHIAADPLVDYGWNPGGSRKPIAIPREEVVQLMEAWDRAGAPCPAPGVSR